VEVAGVITPFFDVTAEAGVTAKYGAASGSITAALTLLNVSLPFEVSVEVINYDQLDAMRLQFDQYASAVLNVLSGSIKFKFTAWVVFVHDHTIASWDGYSWTVNFFEDTQNINLGNDKPNGSWCEPNDRELFEGDFDGDGDIDWLCHKPSTTTTAAMISRATIAIQVSTRSTMQKDHTMDMDERRARVVAPELN